MAYSNFARWLYGKGRPNALARFLNSIWAAIHSRGIAPNYLVTLEVPGRRSGRSISFPLVMVLVDDVRYFVSMLGTEATWVKNIRANQGRARLRHGHHEEVHLIEIPAEQRGPILKAFLQRAPGARPHIPIDKDAPLEAFAALADQYPVFQVESIADV